MSSVQYYITKLSIALQPYKALVGQSAAILSILQLLSPLFSFNEMRKKKSTMGMPFIPFLLIAVL
jgi:Sugar efflux transporter for intercellular exchange